MASIIHVQPALPAYRLDFFERLRLRYGIEVEVYYTAGSLGILTESSKPEWATTVGPIRSLPGGFEWQSGVAGVPIKRGDIVVLSGNPRQLSTLVVLLRARVLGARVIWWGHYWSSTSRRWRQVLRYLPMVLADALLFYTDESENFGIVIVEALAYGLPVITTFGTPWKSLADKECGWWVEASVSAISSALSEAMALSDWERHAMGARGQEYSRQFDWKNIAGDTAKVYQWLLGQADHPDCVRLD